MMYRLLFLLLFVTPLSAKLNVVTSFSILHDLVKNIAGDKITLTNIVGANNDAHIYEPRPRDALALAHADLVIVNGLGFEEGWMHRLIESSGFKGKVITAARSLKPRLASGQDQGVPDPHAWHSIPHVKIYVQNIYQALATHDKKNAAYYYKNFQNYLKKLNALHTWVHKQFNAVPKTKRKMITAHDAFAYFGAEYKVALWSLVGINTESEATARDIARLIDAARREKVRAIFLENITSPKLLEQVASETNISLGGTLYSDALSDASEPGDTYLKMMQHNVKTIAASMH